MCSFTTLDIITMFCPRWAHLYSFDPLYHPQRYFQNVFCGSIITCTHMTHVGFGVHDHDVMFSPRWLGCIIIHPQVTHCVIFKTCHVRSLHHPHDSGGFQCARPRCPCVGHCFNVSNMVRKLLTTHPRDCAHRTVRSTHDECHHARGVQSHLCPPNPLVMPLSITHGTRRWWAFPMLLFDMHTFAAWSLLHEHRVVVPFATIMVGQVGGPF